MSGKRPGFGGGGSGGFSAAALKEKIARLDGQTSVSAQHSAVQRNRYLSTPVQPEKAIQLFLTQVRNTARGYVPKETLKQTDGIVTTPFCEVEVRLGILKVPHAVPDRRVTSGGAKHVNRAVVQAFDCSRVEPAPGMESGVSRSHFLKWTGSGISEIGPVALALGIPGGAGGGAGGGAAGHDALKRGDVVETELVETVYVGYAGDRRVAFNGYHDHLSPPSSGVVGKMEYKEKLQVMDLTVPAAFYDVRVQLASEKVVDKNVREPPAGWKQKRVKRRRSYTRRDKSIAWQIDVTEITTSSNSASGGAGSNSAHAHVSYEIEVELRESVLLQLINESDADKLGKLTTQLANQLWWIMSQINPIADALEVDETLRDHPNKRAVQLALATCGALKRFMDSGQANYESPIGNNKQPPNASLSNVNFIGCMPVNFSRHDMEEIQRSPDNAYFLSEKTDGVRHLLVFTGDTAVLIDRAMRGKQPVPVAVAGGSDNSGTVDPFAPILDLIAPGTVLDGEVVMNRRGRKPRPIFIVFDVMAVNATTPVLHLPFEERLRLLRNSSFRLPSESRDVFDPSAVGNPGVALPLVRKNFVERTDVDELLSYVVEERGMRCYRNGDLHFHLTDGIIFQPNRPYVCGTDRNLLKWKFLDTVTIDVEMLPLRQSDDDDALRVGCMGEEQTSVDMTRHIILPKSERMRLEADKFESGGRIAEVGFDPETGEWYYRTMRSDKVAPNHISTVLGTLLELAESLTTEELRYRLSIPSGQRDTYRKDMRGMLKQLLDHQRKKLHASRSSSSHR